MSSSSLLSLDYLLNTDEAKIFTCNQDSCHAAWTPMSDHLLLSGYAPSCPGHCACYSCYLSQPAEYYLSLRLEVTFLSAQMHFPVSCVDQHSLYRVRGHPTFSVHMAERGLEWRRKVNFMHLKKNFASSTIITWAMKKRKGLMWTRRYLKHTERWYRNSQRKQAMKQKHQDHKSYKGLNTGQY